MRTFRSKSQQVNHQTHVNEPYQLFSIYKKSALPIIINDQVCYFQLHFIIQTPMMIGHVPSIPGFFHKWRKPSLSVIEIIKLEHTIGFFGVSMLFFPSINEVFIQNNHNNWCNFCNIFCIASVFCQLWKNHGWGNSSFVKFGISQILSYTVVIWPFFQFAVTYQSLLYSLSAVRLLKNFALFSIALYDTFVRTRSLKYFSLVPFSMFTSSFIAF